jgi:hypothetical protein
LNQTEEPQRFSKSTVLFTSTGIIGGLIFICTGVFLLRFAVVDLLSFVATTNDTGFCVGGLIASLVGVFLFRAAVTNQADFFLITGTRFEFYKGQKEPDFSDDLSDVSRLERTSDRYGSLYLIHFKSGRSFSFNASNLDAYRFVRLIEERSHQTFH